MSDAAWESSELEKARAILDLWEICVVPDRILTVVGRGDGPVRPIDFGMLIMRLQGSLTGDAIRTVLFFFEDREIPGDAWPIFVRLTEYLSRRTGAQCRIIRVASDRPPAVPGTMQTPAVSFEQEGGSTRCLRWVSGRGTT